MRQFISLWTVGVVVCCLRGAAWMVGIGGRAVLGWGVGLGGRRCMNEKLH